MGGVCLKDFIEAQKQVRDVLRVTCYVLRVTCYVLLNSLSQEHMRQLEAEKHAREKQKKDTLMQETR